MALTDADARFTLQSDPDYVRFIGHQIDRERCARQLEYELQGRAVHLSAAICLMGEEAMIGECVLVPSNVDEVELILALLPAHRGQRYSREVAEAVIRACLASPAITAVIACVEDDNDPSQRLVQSLGMLPEGRIQRPYGATPRRFVSRSVA